MSSIPRETVVDFLKQLSDKQFAELFYEATSARNTSDMEGIPGHYVLADAYREEGVWTVDFVALGSKFPMDSDAPICQSGTCEYCGRDVRSWSKHLICPICGTKGYGT